MSNTYVDMDGWAKVNDIEAVKKLLAEVDMEDKERVDFLNGYLGDDRGVEDWPDFRVYYIDSPQPNEWCVSVYSEDWSNIENSCQFGRMLVDLGLTEQYQLAWCMYGDGVDGGAYHVDKYGAQYVSATSFLMQADTESRIKRREEVSDG